MTKAAEGPAKEAMEAFKDGRHAKAVELAKPLAEQGNADALYLMGFAHESGKGVELSRDKALEYYKEGGGDRSEGRDLPHVVHPSRLGGGEGAHAGPRGAGRCGQG